MREAVIVCGAVAAGLLCGYAVLAGARGVGPSQLAALRSYLQPPQMANARSRLAAEILRAGWRDSPERVAALTVICSGGLAALGLSTAVVFAPVTAAALAITGGAVGIAAV